MRSVVSLEERLAIDLILRWGRGEDLNKMTNSVQVSESGCARRYALHGRNKQFFMRSVQPGLFGHETPLKAAEDAPREVAHSAARLYAGCRIWRQSLYPSRRLLP